MNWKKKEPRLGSGGITRGVSVKEFKVFENLAGVSMHLDPGPIRELHWHVNAAEWGYVLEGQMRTTVISRTLYQKYRIRKTYRIAGF